MLRGRGQAAHRDQEDAGVCARDQAAVRLPVGDQDQRGDRGDGEGVGGERELSRGHLGGLQAGGHRHDRGGARQNLR